MSEFLLNSQLNISITDCDTLLSLGSGDAALVYLYILKNGGKRPTAKDKELKLTDSQISQAILMLEGTGLLKSRKAGLLDESRPTYRADEIAGGIKRDPGFAGVVGEVEKILGKILSSSDMQILFSIYDWRGLPAVVIIMLVHYCADEARRKYGGGSNPPTMKQIDKEAASWEREGILTIDEAEQHIKKLEKRRSSLAEIQKIIGISGRMPTPTEQKYIDAWLSLGFTPELVGLAYDRTVVNTGKMTWKYCDAIIRSWAEKGVKSSGDIDIYDQNKPQIAGPRSKNSLKSDGQSSPGSRELDSVAKIRELIRQREKK